MINIKYRLATVFLILLFFFKFSPTVTKSLTDLLEGWYSGNTLPFSLVRHQPIVYNNKVYLFGGSGINDIDHDEIFRANINPDGSLTPWEILTVKLPLKIQAHSLVMKDNRVYIMGGFGSSVPGRYSSNKVYFATIDMVSGDISAWEELNSLPKGVDSGGAILYDNNIFFFGGVSRGPSGYTYESSVYKTTINLAGSINTWETLSPLPSTRAAFAYFLINNRIIIMGGSMSDSNFYLNTVIYSDINPDGTLTFWSNGSNLSRNLHAPIYSKNNEFFFLTGGVGLGRTFYDTTIFSSIGTDGLPTNWSESSILLPTVNCCVPGLLHNNNIYIAGGHDGSTYFSYTGRLTLKNMSSSPTPTPTPIPQKILNVEDIKQYATPWGGQVYDHADIWSPNPTIKRWGCALTSAVMTLRYYNHNVLPDTLNNWLNTQVDGYIRNGLLNWLAITRFSKINENKIDEVKDSRILEYKRTGIPSISDIKAQVDLGQPSIPKFPGHFAVSKGYIRENIKINDPASALSNLSDLIAQRGAVINLNNFTPTNTDLSYIMLNIDNEADIQITKPNKDPVNFDVFSDGPLEDEEDFSNLSGSGETLKTYLIEKPSDDYYLLNVTDPNGYSLDLYIYDQNGNVKKESYSGNQEGEYLFSKRSEFPSLYDPDFQDLISVINKGYKNKQIKKLPTYKKMLSLAIKAYYFDSTGKEQKSDSKLSDLKRLVLASTPSSIEESLSKYLIAIIEYLIQK